MNIPELTSVMGKYHLKPVFHPKYKNLSYTGTLKIEDLRIEIKLVFPSYYPTDYPSCYITNWAGNDELQKALGVAHVDANGRYCYINPIEHWWDSSLLKETVKWTIEQLKASLKNRITNNSNALFYDDYISYWNGDEKLYKYEPLKEGVIYYLNKANFSQYISSKDKDKSKLVVDYIKLDKLPVPKNYNNWPPSNISDLFLWLEQSKTDQDKFYNLLVKSIKKSSNSIFYIAIEIPYRGNKDYKNIQILVKLTLTLRTLKTIRKIIIKKNVILGALKRDPCNLLKRYTILDATENYIYSRNSPDKEIPFMNKKILLIGAGTIGGHLCSYLAALGAGIGEEGVLTIVDHDILKPENISRHYLGMEFINLNKALALKKALNQSHTHANIKAKMDRFENDFNPSNYDLIINASGMQNVATNLEVLTKEDKTPILHCWVEGNGSSVHALINKKDGKACFNCLWVGKDIAKIDYTPAACHESFVAYTITVPVKAATLACDVAQKVFKKDIVDNMYSINLESGLMNYSQSRIDSNFKCHICH